MGITGLLPLLKPIHHFTHISEFAGKCLAVDGYVWLHRGAYACAVELVTGRPTHKYVDYFLNRVRLLRHHKITPYIVFDGGHLPAKQGTESDRKKRREENLRQATALANAGKHSDAREYYTKCVDVTPQMAYQVIKALRAEQVSYVVAPYEADAQMRYLESEGIVDGIITEDSDLLVFGARCVLFKFDTAGHVVVIRREDFGLLHTKTASFIGWNDNHFREMAIMSGCDYLDSIQGIGVITAAKLMRKYKSVEKVLQSIRMEGNKKIPKDYLAAFRMAELAFKHQRVYDPRTQRLAYLTEPSDGTLDEKQEAYVGRDLDPELARSIASGDRDPSTHEPMADINPSYNPDATRSTLRHPLAETSRANVGQNGKANVEAKTRGIMSFFTPVPKSVGKDSGKTSLSEVMQLDIDKRLQAQKEMEKRIVSAATARSPSPMRSPQKTSRFFSTAAMPSPVKKPSKRTLEDNDFETPRRSKSRRREQDENDSSFDVLKDEREDGMVVEQDTGYMSPCSVASDKSWLSETGFTSPVDHRSPLQKKNKDQSPFDDVDPISSPIRERSKGTFLHGVVSFAAPSLLRRSVTLPARPEPPRAPLIKQEDDGCADEDLFIPGPDLADMFDDGEDGDIFREDGHALATMGDHATSSARLPVESSPTEEERDVIIVPSSSPLRPPAPFPAPPVSLPPIQDADGSLVLVESSSPIRPRTTTVRPGHHPMPSSSKTRILDETGESPFQSQSQVPPETQINIEPDMFSDLDDEDIFAERQKKISEGWRKAYAMRASMGESPFAFDFAALKTTTNVKSSPASPAIVKTPVQKASGVTMGTGLSRRYSAPVKSTPKTTGKSRLPPSTLKTSVTKPTPGGLKQSFSEKMEVFRFRG